MCFEYGCQCVFLFPVQANTVVVGKQQTSGMIIIHIGGSREALI